MDELIKKHRNKLILEGIIKSVMLGGAIAAVCAAVVALIVWFVPGEASVVWSAVGVFLGGTAVASPVIYFLKFRPSDIDLARRLDRLGLKERVITMYEYTGSLNPAAVGAGASGAAFNSAVMAAQTADTAAALKALSEKGTKTGLVSIPAKVIIPLVVALVPFGGMIAVGALAETEVIPTGYEIIRQVADPVTEKFYTVTYRAALLDLQNGMIAIDAGGLIDGDDEQLVAYTVNSSGEVLSTSEATPVLAIEDDDCVFLFWDGDDSQTDPYRQDIEIAPMGDNYKTDEDGNIIITHIAYFARLEGGDGESGDGEGGSSEDGDSSDGESGDEKQEGDEPQDAPDSDANEDSNQKPDDSNTNDGNAEEGDPNDGRGGNYNPEKDNIIDGNQNYRDLYQQYYDEAMAIIAAGGELPEYYKKIIEAYFGVIV